jgi:hypothetical protein
MDALPLLPKRKSVWIACFGLILILFWYYYTFLYQGLLYSYQKQNLVIAYAYIQNDSLTKDLETNLIIPRSLGADTVQYATISVHNLKQESMNLKLRLVWEKNTGEDEDFKQKLSILGLMDAIEPGEVSVQVQPNSFGFVRLPLIFIGDSIDLEKELFILVTVLSPQGDNIGQEMLSARKINIPVVNRIRSSLYFILKNLLLPPLANGLLAGLAIMSCWFFEEKADTDEKINLEEVLKIFLKSTLLSITLISIFYLAEIEKIIYVHIFLLMAVWLYIFINRKTFLLIVIDIKDNWKIRFGGGQA